MNYKIIIFASVLLPLQCLSSDDSRLPKNLGQTWEVNVGNLLYSAAKGLYQRAKNAPSQASEETRGYEPMKMYDFSLDQLRDENDNDAKEENKSQDQKDESECPICLDPINNSEKVVLACQGMHPLHEGCYKDYQKSNPNRCPYGLCEYAPMIHANLVESVQEREQRRTRDRMQAADDYNQMLRQHLLEQAQLFGYAPRRGQSEEDFLQFLQTDFEFMSLAMDSLPQ